MMVRKLYIVSHPEFPYIKFGVIMFISEVCHENYSKQYIIKHSPCFLTHSNNTETVSINILDTFILKLSPKALTFERSCTNFYLFICKARFIDIIQAYIKRINAEGTLRVSFVYFFFIYLQSSIYRHYASLY